MLHGTCRHILFEKKSDQKKLAEDFSAKICWSLPTKERLAQHTTLENDRLARDSSDKRRTGQDRFD
jgi:hypothetical protein